MIVLTQRLSIKWHHALPLHHESLEESALRAASLGDEPATCTSVCCWKIWHFDFAALVSDRAESRWLETVEVIAIVATMVIISADSKADCIGIAERIQEAILVIGECLDFEH